MKGSTAATALLGAVLAAWVSPAQAQTAYPVGTVTIVTHSSPGGGNDLYLREMAKHLGPALGATVVVENVRGGGGAAAMARVANAPADGSMLIGMAPAFVNTSLLARPEHDISDLAPVANVFTDPLFVYARADSRFADLRAAVASAVGGGERQRWGVPTPGSLERQVMESLKRATSADAAVVTHEGGSDLLVNVLNGTLTLGVGEVGEIRPQLDAGELKLLAVLTEERAGFRPDVPTAREQGIDVAVTKFRGIGAPAAIAPPLAAALADAVRRVLEEPSFRAWHDANGLQPRFMGPDEFAAFLGRYSESEAAFLREHGILRN